MLQLIHFVLSWLLVALASSGTVAAVSLSTASSTTYHELTYELHRPSRDCLLVYEGEAKRVPFRRRASARSVVVVDEKEVLPAKVGLEFALKGSNLDRVAIHHLQQQRRASETSLISLYATDHTQLYPFADGDAISRPFGQSLPSQACASWQILDEIVDEIGVEAGDQPEVQATFDILESINDSRKKNEVPNGMELSPLKVSGPASNRVNLAFFADGYTLDEREKFLADARRLADAMTDDVSLRSTAPLFNFWAVFVPSNESGVGANGVPKDTPFGLYRDGHELRGLYSAHRSRARAACRAVREGYFGEGVGGCDQMALISNFPYYGGLGGEFTITTASKLNGALVLRHEIGHSLIDVGEEYEGGYAYFGANSADNLTAVRDKWGTWLSEPFGEIRSEDIVTPLQAYPWQDLTATNWSTTFTTKGRHMYPRTMLRFSTAGLRESDEMSVFLDGHLIDWTLPPAWRGSLDRAWIEVQNPLGNGGLPAGEHRIEFVLKGGLPPLETEDIVRQICSVEITEYGTADRFHSRPGYIGAFPTYSMYNTTSYRPTNEGCLMRMVATPGFCSPCLESLWLKQLSKISLIDDLKASVSSERVIFHLTLLPLAHHRIPPSLPTSGETWSIKWFHRNVHVPQLDGVESVVLNRADALGTFAVEVNLRTDEVRRDDEGWTRERWEWIVGMEGVELK